MDTYPLIIAIIRFFQFDYLLKIPVLPNNRYFQQLKHPERKKESNLGWGETESYNLVFFSFKLHRMLALPVFAVWSFSFTFPWFMTRHSRVFPLFATLDDDIQGLPLHFSTFVVCFLKVLKKKKENKRNMSTWQEGSLCCHCLCWRGHRVPVCRVRDGKA